LQTEPDENARFKVTLERIIAVSKLAFRDGVPERIGEVGETESVQRQAIGLL
jgi:hypothetical protein